MSFFASMMLSRGKSAGNDPLRTLDAAYRQQVEALARAQAGVAELGLAERKLELEARGLAASRERFSDAAEAAERAGDSDAHGAARENALTAAAQHERVVVHASELRATRLRLESMLESVRLRIEVFRAEKLAAGVRLVAARSASRSGLSLEGLSSELSALERRAEDACRQSAQALAQPAPGAVPES